jgi:hypothetical protein
VTWQPDHHMADDRVIDGMLPEDPIAAQPLPALPLPAEEMTDEPMTGARAIDSDDPDLVIVDSGTEFTNGADISNGTTGTGYAPSGGLSDQWHDIQAMFVDDPQSSVERAAQETEAAVSALIESLRQRQAALSPSAGSSDASDTEQLRAALRGYRLFCERLVGLEEQLSRSGAMAL